MSQQIYTQAENLFYRDANMRLFIRYYYYRKIRTIYWIFEFGCPWSSCEHLPWTWRGNSELPSVSQKQHLILKGKACFQIYVLSNTLNIFFAEVTMELTSSCMLSYNYRIFPLTKESQSVRICNSNISIFVCTET
jgi:hypothetical protein